MSWLTAQYRKRADRRSIARHSAVAGAAANAALEKARRKPRLRHAAVAGAASATALHSSASRARPDGVHGNHGNHGNDASTPLAKRSHTPQISMQIMRALRDEKLLRMFKAWRAVSSVLAISSTPDGENKRAFDPLSGCDTRDSSNSSSNDSMTVGQEEHFGDVKRVVTKEETKHERTEDHTAKVRIYCGTFCSLWSE